MNYMNNPQSQRRFYSDIRHTVSSAIKSENSYHPVESYGSAVEDLLKTHIKEKCSTAIDLGSYTGKWLPHLGKYAQKIICADLIDNNFSMIQERFKEEKFDLSFYLTEGNELSGIEDESVDFIFSIDSLVRCDGNILKEYFKEFSRVLKPNGKVIIHYNHSPAKDMPVIPIREGREICQNTDFIIIDELEIFTLGVVMVALK